MSLILLLTSLSRDNRNLFGLSGRLGKTPQMYSFKCIPPRQKQLSFGLLEKNFWIYA